ncbi:MAG: PKD domain-containing protein [Bacteroidales bacterium]|nr:PKD domain-containing protein [Bacteroidales bacterium]
MKTKRIFAISLLAIAAFFILSAEQTTCDPKKDKYKEGLYYEDCTPIVDFSADDTTFYPGDWVNFQFTGDLGSENDVNYHWILPGSNYNSIEGTRFLTVMYTSVGTYDATLIVSNECGMDTLVKPGYITVKPY